MPSAIQTDPTEVELARIEQPDKENPVEVTILKGRLRYLGQVRLDLAGQKWRAYEYSLKVALRPDSLIWVSEKGLLLAVAVEHGHANWREEGLKLVRFHQWAELLDRAKLAIAHHSFREHLGIKPHSRGLEVPWPYWIPRRGSCCESWLPSDARRRALPAIE